MIPGQHLDATLTQFEKVGVHNKIVSGLAVGQVLVVDRVDGKVVRVNGQVVRHMADAEVRLLDHSFEANGFLDLVDG